MAKKEKPVGNDAHGVPQEEMHNDVTPQETETPQEPTELEKLKDQLLRTIAEYDNYRKRTARERIELEADIVAKTITGILPALDNLERALLAECKDENYKKGIEMIHGSFLETLKSLGVEEVVEEDFDPAVHQAVQHVESELESGKVVQTFQKGYKIGNKIIRFAMVSIAQ
ncbi:MAG: nucleotide exchange factor GrpE [Oscillospiraceae bacterium]|nr:nucleotide exchange factor GrpE [Oscillospiraceae bacterium]